MIPSEHVLLNPAYRPEMRGVEPPNNVYAHIAGIDLVRTGERDFYVLEDNLRTPSGVSYMLENRKMMMRLFPELFSRPALSPVEHYPELLLENLRAVAPARAPTDPGGRAAHARAATTAPISSTRSWPSRWASSWSRAATSSCATTRSACARPSGPARST